jgi:hypothetical protein
MASAQTTAGGATFAGVAGRLLQIMPMRTLRRHGLRLAGVAWVVALGIGFTILWRYESTPGDARLAAARWPSDSALERTPDRETLVLFAHPRCACTRASLAELRGLLPRLPRALRAYVVFLVPDGVAEGWESSDLWQTAAAIPGVDVRVDREGRESERFGATTSGATLLYDPEGRLLFSGGLTATRGHQGDSFGQHRILALLGDGQADRNTSPVFGCALRDPEPSGGPP